jgi:hypothetical protein
MKNTIIGILAHVDAGKTTFSEQLLCHAGALRAAGRVDHGDALLDSDAQEKKRGITIFAGQAVFTLPQAEDAPAEEASEMEAEAAPVQAAVAEGQIADLIRRIDTNREVLSIKIEEKEDGTSTLFVNGSSSAWKSKVVGGLGLKMLSRRFDIEFRTQYVYSYDAANEKYVEYAVKVPMIFVQEENYETFIDDVKSANKISIGVNVANSDFKKLLSEYDARIPTFVENKGKVTPDMIVEYIGNKVVFE